MRLDPHIHRNLFLTRMLEDFTNYFKIYDFTKLKIKKALEGFEEVMDEKDFWSKVLDERFAAKEANPHQFQNG